MESNFLDTHFAAMDIYDHTIALGCAENILTACLARGPVYNWHLSKVLMLATTQVLYKILEMGYEKIP